MSAHAAFEWNVLLKGRLWLAALMGFAGGLPLLLTLTVLQAWLTQENTSLGTIGVLASVMGLPYTLKFLWAPIVDRYKPLALGRRRGWLLIAQLALAASIALMGFQSPGEHLLGVVLAGFLVTFFSATQDVIIDAYRRESLLDREQGLGASFYTYGYRLGMLLASAGGLILADIIGFQGVYLVMAGVMLACVPVTLLAPEPEQTGRPRSIAESFVGPFVEFFTRSDVAKALLVLTFIVAYKLGDNIANHMSIPFYLSLGFSNTEIGAVAKVVGAGAVLLGVAVGGACTLRLGLYRAMLAIGVLQALSTACYVLLALAGHHRGWLTGVIAFENLTVGMGTAALLAFMAAITNKQFTATQFALLSTLATLPRAVLAAPSGYLAEFLGWPQFFVACTLIALPGLLLLPVVRHWFGDAAVRRVPAEGGRSAVVDAS
ncbi:MAG TPA: MFS transporter [Gammaproteobacteria bacterium]